MLDHKLVIRGKRVNGKLKKGSEKGSLLLLTFISSSAGYLVSLFN